MQPGVARGAAYAGRRQIHTRTVVLLTPEEIDEAARKTPAYRAPGA